MYRTSTATSALNPGVMKREVFAWSMYDFANSGYTTVVLTAVFNAYFVSVVAQKAEWATFAWTAVLAVSYLAVMIAGPFIGAYADARAAKKRVLMIVTTGCVISTALLSLAGPGMIIWAAVFVIISNFCYAIGENITAAFLPELAKPESLGKVSGWGWSLGYVGGLVALGICLAWIMTAETRGQSTSNAVPATNLITAVVYALGAIVTFIWLKERSIPAPISSDALSAYARLAKTAREAARYNDLLRVFVGRLIPFFPFLKGRERRLVLIHRGLVFLEIGQRSVAGNERDLRQVGRHDGLEANHRTTILHPRAHFFEQLMRAGQL